MCVNKYWLLRRTSKLSCDYGQGVFQRRGLQSIVKTHELMRARAHTSDKTDQCFRREAEALHPRDR